MTWVYAWCCPCCVFLSDELKRQLRSSGASYTDECNLRYDGRSMQLHRHDHRQHVPVRSGSPFSINVYPGVSDTYMDERRPAVDHPIVVGGLEEFRDEHIRLSIAAVSISGKLFQFRDGTIVDLELIVQDPFPMIDSRANCAVACAHSERSRSKRLRDCDGRSLCSTKVGRRCIGPLDQRLSRMQFISEPCVGRPRRRRCNGRNPRCWIGCDGRGPHVRYRPGGPGGYDRPRWIRRRLLHLWRLLHRYRCTRCCRPREHRRHILAGLR